MLNKKLKLFKSSDIVEFLKQKKIYTNENNIWGLSMTKDYDGNKYNYFINGHVVDENNNKFEKEFALYVDDTHFVINVFSKYNLGLVIETKIIKYNDISEQWIVYLYKKYPQKSKLILNNITKQMNNELKKIDQKISHKTCNLKVAKEQKQKIKNKYYKLLKMMKPNNEELAK